MAEPAGAPLIPLLYSDKYVDVYETKVVVKGLYFPWGSIGHKNIQMEDIESVDSGSDLRLKWWQVKGWGIPLTNIAWACDLSRIGFSTMSPQTVKGLIRARARGTK